ncbi:MAG: hypothetical protein FWG72_03815 [Oscillospiraceae bacterium]|nr:hypothetical protein [Oscillospiraceae bacterium]
MPEQRNSRERILILFVCVLVMSAAYVVLLSTGIVAVGEGSGFYMDGIDADAVVVRHEAAAGNHAVVYHMVTLTNPPVVERLLHIRNTVFVQLSRQRGGTERYALYFYKDDEEVEQWHVSLNRTATFSTHRGTYEIVNEDFDLAYIAGLLD